MAEDNVMWREGLTSPPSDEISPPAQLPGFSITSALSAVRTFFTPDRNANVGQRSLGITPLCERLQSINLNQTSPADECLNLTPTSDVYETANNTIISNMSADNSEILDFSISNVDHEQTVLSHQSENGLDATISDAQNTSPAVAKTPLVKTPVRCYDIVENLQATQFKLIDASTPEMFSVSKRRQVTDLLSETIDNVTYERPASNSILGRRLDFCTLKTTDFFGDTCLSDVNGFVNGVIVEAETFVSHKKEEGNVKNIAEKEAVQDLSISMGENVKKNATSLTAQHEEPPPLVSAQVQEIQPNSHTKEKANFENIVVEEKEVVQEFSDAIPVGETKKNATSFTEQRDVPSAFVSALVQDTQPIVNNVIPEEIPTVEKVLQEPLKPEITSHPVFDLLSQTIDLTEADIVPDPIRVTVDTSAFVDLSDTVPVEDPNGSNNIFEDSVIRIDQSYLQDEVKENNTTANLEAESTEKIPLPATLESNLPITSETAKIELAGTVPVVEEVKVIPEVNSTVTSEFQPVQNNLSDNLLLAGEINMPEVEDATPISKIAPQQLEPEKNRPSIDRLSESIPSEEKSLEISKTESLQEETVHNVSANSAIHPSKEDLQVELDIKEVVSQIMKKSETEFDTSVIPMDVDELSFNVTLPRQDFVIDACLPESELKAYMDGSSFIANITTEPDFVLNDATYVEAVPEPDVSPMEVDQSVLNVSHEFEVFSKNESAIAFAPSDVALTQSPHGFEVISPSNVPQAVEKVISQVIARAEEAASDVALTRPSITNDLPAAPSDVALTRSPHGFEVISPSNVPQAVEKVISQVIARAEEAASDVALTRPPMTGDLPAAPSDMTLTQSPHRFEVISPSNVPQNIEKVISEIIAGPEAAASDVALTRPPMTGDLPAATSNMTLTQSPHGFEVISPSNMPQDVGKVISEIIAEAEEAVSDVVLTRSPIADNLPAAPSDMTLTQSPHEFEVISPSNVPQEVEKVISQAIAGPEAAASDVVLTRPPITGELPAAPSDMTLTQSPHGFEVISPSNIPQDVGKVISEIIAEAEEAVSDVVLTRSPIADNLPAAPSDTTHTQSPHSHEFEVISASNVQQDITDVMKVISEVIAGAEAAASDVVLNRSPITGDLPAVPQDVQEDIACDIALTKSHLTTMKSEVERVVSEIVTEAESAASDVSLTQKQEDKQIALKSDAERVISEVIIEAEKSASDVFLPRSPEKVTAENVISELILKAEEIVNQSPKILVSSDLRPESDVLNVIAEVITEAETIANQSDVKLPRTPKNMGKTPTPESSRVHKITSAPRSGKFDGKLSPQKVAYLDFSMEESYAEVSSVTNGEVDESQMSCGSPEEVLEYDDAEVDETQEEQAVAVLSPILEITEVSICCDDSFVKPLPVNLIRRKSHVQSPKAPIPCEDTFVEPQPRKWPGDCFDSPTENMRDKMQIQSTPLALARVLNESKIDVSPVTDYSSPTSGVNSPMDGLLNVAVMDTLSNTPNENSDTSFHVSGNASLNKIRNEAKVVVVSPYNKPVLSPNVLSNNAQNNQCTGVLREINDNIMGGVLSGFKKESFKPLEMSEEEKTKQHLQLEIERIRKLIAENQKKEDLAEIAHKAKIAELDAKIALATQVTIDSDVRNSALDKEIKERELTYQQSVMVAKQCRKYSKLLRDYLESTPRVNLAPLEADLASVKEHIQSAEAAYVDVHSKLEGLRANISRIKTTCTDLEIQVVELGSANAGLEERIRSTEIGTRAELDELKKAIEEEEVHKQKEILKIHAQLRKTQLAVDSAQKAIDKVTVDNERISALCDDLISGKS